MRKEPRTFAPTIVCRIDEIRIGTRCRKDLGDLAGLAESMRSGVLQPIGVTEDKELVFGLRRIRAADLLGWKEIDARVVNVTSILAGEYAENLVRKDFTISERVSIAEAVRRNAGERRGRPSGKKVADPPQFTQGRKTRDLAAERAGFTSTTIYREAKVVVDRDVPELVKAMDQQRLSVSAAAAIIGLPTDELRRIATSARPDVEARRAANRIERARIVDPKAELDRAAELQRKWGTKLGQLWQIGPHRLLCGDCTEESNVGRLWAHGGPKCRLVWTDPPYGVNYAEKTAWMERHGAQRTRREIEGDNLSPDDVAALFAQALLNILPYAEAGAALYATVPSTLTVEFTRAMEKGGFGYRHGLVWVKQTFVMGRADYHYRHEPILYGWLENGPHYFTDDRTQDSVFEIDRPTASELHPTTKPVELIARMVANSSRPGEVVYDPFCGSGSTIIAAHQLGRIAYACEIDPGYTAVALERLAALGLVPELVATVSSGRSIARVSEARRPPAGVVAPA